MGATTARHFESQILFVKLSPGRPPELRTPAQPELTPRLWCGVRKRDELTGNGAATSAGIKVRDWSVLVR